MSEGVRRDVLLSSPPTSTLDLSALDSQGVVGLTGLEPVTLRLSSACSNQLSYRPQGSVPSFQTKRKVEAWGFEPQTYSLQSYRSTN